MDGLALLCNLFADGPVTLKRLRAARIASLGELERAAPERLADWLHASVPQARAFVEEARKLVRRLAETAAPVPVSPASRSVRARAGARAGADEVAHEQPPPIPGRSASEPALRPGLFPGLDEGICARLVQHHVRTVQALSESAGLSLARRTGIPYSTLLELARGARRTLSARPGTARPPRAVGPALGESELVPFVLRPRRAPAENELQRSDEFTLPVEPEPAGPFG